MASVATTFEEAVSWEIDPADSRMRVTDRLAARLPELLRRVWHRAEAEPAGSRLRRKLLSRGQQAGWAAIDRRDWEYLRRIYDPDVELRWGEGKFIDVGEYDRGWPSVQKTLESVYEAFDTTQAPREIIDFGGPFHAVRVGTDVTGPSSGIKLYQELILLYEINAGLCVRQWSSSDREEIQGWLTERVAALG
jgi:hypothetical protein